MHKTREPQRVLQQVRMTKPLREERRTSHLLEALLVLPADCVVLLLQRFQTACQRIGDLRLVISIFGACLVIVQGGLHLLNCLDQPVCFFRHFMLFVGDSAQLAVERI